MSITYSTVAVQANKPDSGATAGPPCSLSPEQHQNFFEYLEGLNKRAAACARFSDQRQRYVGWLAAMWRWYGRTAPPDYRMMLLRWIVANGEPDFLAAMILDEHNLHPELMRRAIRRISIFELQGQILAALYPKRKAQRLDAEFHKLLRVVNGVARGSFDEAVSGLLKMGRIRMTASAQGLAIALANKDARAEAARCYSERTMVNQIHGRDEWRYGEEQVVKFKSGFILDWVRELGTMPDCESTYEFFTAWTFCDGEMVREFIAEMVAAGTLKPCIIAGKMAVTA